MKRRTFIKTSLKAIPLVWMTPSVMASSCQKDKSETSSHSKTVFVIGAGISGLAAAQKLAAHGFQVTVLEAQQKVGGRLSTQRSLGFAFDEGASWIHGINGNPITSLAEKAGMKTAFTDDESSISYDIGGVMRSDSSFNTAENELYAILNSMMRKGNDTQSFETVFNQLYPEKANDRLWQMLLSTYVTFDTGDLNHLSSKLYNEGEEFEGQERIATNGYDTIPNYLANGLNIQLNQRVSKIDYSNSKIKITHNQTESEADYVLVTVPLGVLKSGNIQFQPQLPTAKQNAIQKLGMNCVNKFVLTWDIPFWDDVQYISYSPAVKDKFNYFVNLSKCLPNVNALMTFAYADEARRTETLSDAQVTNEIMAHLKDIYGNAIPNPSQMLRTKWQSNENSFGSYSYTAVGSEMRHFEDLAAEINNKLFFAGEHTEVDYFSTAHGAYLSGIREADKIIELS